MYIRRKQHGLTPFFGIHFIKSTHEAIMTFITFAGSPLPWVGFLQMRLSNGLPIG
jgi:hypothetical protein